MTAQLWVFAGPNGAGKSTLVAQRVQGRIPITNPDEIARSLPAHIIGAARMIKAGRLAILERDAHLAVGRSFGLETTLTGRSELDLMVRAKAAGYRVNLVFIGLRSPQLSMARVQSRVGRGGHDVPRTDLLRRFGRSMANLSVALMIADRAYVFDNSGVRRDFLFSRERGRTKHLSPVLPPWAAEAIPADMQRKRLTVLDSAVWPNVFSLSLMIATLRRRRSQ